MEPIHCAVCEFLGSTDSVICDVPYLAAGYCNYVVK